MQTMKFKTETLEKLPDITEVTPFNLNDKPVFDEIAEVLRKHNADKRFGLTLLHQHFEIKSDEILVESTDVEKRVQTIEPVKFRNIEAMKPIETSWRLDNGKTVCVCVCVQHDKLGNGSHCPQ